MGIFTKIQAWLFKKQNDVLSTAPNLVKQGFKEEIEIYKRSHNGELPAKFWLIKRSQEVKNFKRGCDMCGIKMSDLDSIAEEMLEKATKK